MIVTILDGTINDSDKAKVTESILRAAVAKAETL